MYKIKRVDPADDEIEQTIRELHKATFGDSAPMVDPFIKGDWWLAYHYELNVAGVGYSGGWSPVGFAGLQGRSDMPEGFGYLKRCGVLPAHQRQGLQGRFIRVREALARRFGWLHLVTDTTDNVQSAN